MESVPALETRWVNAQAPIYCPVVQQGKNLPGPHLAMLRCESWRHTLQQWVFIKDICVFRLVWVPTWAISLCLTPIPTSIPSSLGTPSVPKLLSLPRIFSITTIVTGNYNCGWWSYHLDWYTKPTKNRNLGPCLRDSSALMNDTGGRCDAHKD